MATVRTANATLSVALGVSAAEVRDRASMLRAGGVLPTETARGRGAPHLQLDQIVALCISLMAGGAISNSAVAPKRLMGARWSSTKTETVVDNFTGTFDEPNTGEQKPPGIAKPTEPFGERLIKMVDEATSREARAWQQKYVHEITIWGDGSMASIRYLPKKNKALIQFYQPDPNADSLAPMLLSRVPFQRLATVSGTILAVLADLVIDTRQYEEVQKQKAGTVGAEPANPIAHNSLPTQG